MAQKDKLLHIFGELGALVFVVPFLLMLLNRYSFKRLDKIGIWVIIIVTLIIDGYLLFSWNGKETFDNGRKEMINRLIKQTSRWAVAAEQDNSNMIAVLHSNYSLGYWWALKDSFDDDEIDKVLGSKKKRKKLEKRLLEIQEKVTRKAVKDCPKYTDTIDFISELAGES
jgi:hypothetical protein